MNYLKVKEVAKRLSCSENKVYSLCQSGKLPYYDIQTKPGARPAYRIPESALESLCNPEPKIKPVTGSYTERFISYRNRLAKEQV